MSTTRDLLQLIPMQISDQQIQNVLSKFPVLTDLRDVSWQPVTSGFSGAAIFCIQKSTYRYCLRRWPQPGLPLKRILGLHQLLRCIANQNGQTVAVPMTSQSGDSLVVMPDGYWQLEPWLTGRADYLTNPSDERLKAAMHALAKWHNAAKKFSPKSSQTEWFSAAESALVPAVHERHERLTRWLHCDLATLARSMKLNCENSGFDQLAVQQIELFKLTAEKVRLQLQHLLDTSFRIQPCLRDIWHDHLLFEGNKVTGLIDPSAARTDHVACDLSRLLGSLLGDDPVRWQAGLDAYAERAPLSEQERVLTLILDRSGVVLSGMTWLERISNEVTRIHYLDEHNRIRTDVAKRMQSIVQRHKQLAQQL